MLIIFALAALLLLAAFALVIVVPTMIVVTVVRSRRRTWHDSSTPAVDSGSAFGELVVPEWTSETALLPKVDTARQ